MNSKPRSALLLWIPLLSLWACGVPKAPATPKATGVAIAAHAEQPRSVKKPEDNPKPPAPSGEAEPSQPHAPAPPSPSALYKRAIEAEDWQQALELLQTQPAGVEAKLYARAQLEMRLGNATQALPLLKQLWLTDSLPKTLRKRAKADHLELALQSLPTEQLVDAVMDPVSVRRAQKTIHWRELGKPAPLLQLARSLVGEKDYERALPLVDRALSQRNTHRQRIELRWLRALIALAKGHKFRAYMDWHWLVEFAPESSEAQLAELLLNQYFPHNPLSPDERHKRAKRFADKGLTRLLEKELQALKQQRYYRLSESEQLHLLGTAAYNSRRFADAARLLAQPLTNGHQRNLKDQYLAGRAYARSNQHQPAIDLFQKLASDKPKTSLTTESRFRLAREFARTGQFSEAKTQFSEFLKDSPGHEHHVSARRELAITEFKLGNNRAATDIFHLLRVRKPGSKDSHLYTNLEALARLQAGQRELAEAIWRLSRLENPLGFGAWSARQRLRQLPPEPTPPRTPKPTSPELLTKRAEQLVHPVSAPAVAVSTVAVPSVAVPSVAVPSVAVPSVAVPSVAVPSVAVPSASAPQASVPPAASGASVPNAPAQRAATQASPHPRTVTPLSLTPAGSQVPPLGSLPPLVGELEELGMFDAAESLMRRSGGWWNQYGKARTQAACQSTAQLTYGRYRFLVGLDAAAQTDLFSSPHNAPRWVWECAYPTPFRNWVNEAAREFNVHPALIYGVMRQESGFRTSVRSPANAWGLMQIIPPTGKSIARSLGLQFKTEHLLNPKTNIRFGAFYLSQLLKRFEGHPVLAAAAYNAGPEAVQRWTEHTLPLPIEMVVASIPYTETRNYVQYVLANVEIYQQLYAWDRPALSVPLQLQPRSSSL